MLGSLINGKFSNKCKHSVKCIKCRLEMIRKKKQAMLRCLKKDIADLISGGHDGNAYGRMDALIVEINKSSCYDMIEQYCCCILEHLRAMQKDRVCPEETTEAIATLIFAAARFSDLPELTDLRHQFAARYGTHMEAYINKEFIEKMQKKSFSKDKKLQLMQHITQDFSIHWDVNAFEYKISNSSEPTHDQPKMHFSSNDENKQQPHMFIGRREAPDGSNEVFNGGKPVRSKADNSGTAYRSNDMQKQAKSEKLANSEVVKEEQNTIEMERYVRHPGSAVQKEVATDQLENVESHQVDKRVPANARSNGSQNGNYAKDWNCKGRKVSESVCERMGSIGIEKVVVTSMISGDAKAINIHPPYTKLTEDMNRTSTNHAHSVNENAASNRPFNPKPPYVRHKVTRSLTETGSGGPTNDSAVDVATHLKNAPFSVRTKRLDQAPAPISEPTDDNRQIFTPPPSKRTEDDGINRSTHRAFSELPRHGCTQSSQEHEHEEEMMDDPLVYYSNRKGRGRMREPSALPTVLGKPQVEAVIRRPVRISSLQQDQLSSCGEHTPSKLSDHEDLAARFAALKRI